MYSRNNKTKRNRHTIISITFQNYFSNDMVSIKIQSHQSIHSLKTILNLPYNFSLGIQQSLFGPSFYKKQLQFIKNFEIFEDEDPAEIHETIYEYYKDLIDPHQATDDFPNFPTKWQKVLDLIQHDYLKNFSANKLSLGPASLECLYILLWIMYNQLFLDFKEEHPDNIMEFFDDNQFLSAWTPEQLIQKLSTINQHMLIVDNHTSIISIANELDIMLSNINLIIIPHIELNIYSINGTVIPFKIYIHKTFNELKALLILHHNIPTECSFFYNKSEKDDPIINLDTIIKDYIIDNNLDINFSIPVSILYN